MIESFKSYAVMVAVRGSTLTADQRHVLCHMALRAGPEGLCWTSIGTLVDDTGISERTVQRCVGALVAAGVLVVVVAPEHRTRTYRFDLDAIPRPVEGAIATGCQADTGVTVAGEGVSLTDEGVMVAGEGASLTPNPSQSSPSSVPEQSLPIVVRVEPPAPLVEDDPTVFDLASPATVLDPTPKWARGHKGTPAISVQSAVVRALTAIRGRPVDPGRCETDAKAVVGLWKANQHPPIDAFASEVELVAEWALLAPDAENDIRGLRPNGERWGPDRSRAVATICRHERWGDRIEAARRWKENPKAPSATGKRAHDPPARQEPAHVRSSAEEDALDAEIARLEEASRKQAEAEEAVVRRAVESRQPRPRQVVR